MASKSFSYTLRQLARPSTQPRVIPTKPLLSQSRKALFRHPSPFSTPPTLRLVHSIPRPPSSTPTPSSSKPDPTPNTNRPPHYELTFTCIPCGERSAHNISKQGYHHGSVLITCPKCRNRHVISDHLSIFGNRSLTVEDLMRERGQLVKRGTLGEDGDIEFWEDGSTTSRTDRQATTDPKVKPRGGEENADAPGSTRRQA